MTDYDSLPAGAELDQLVAERVLGQKAGILNGKCRVIPDYGCCLTHGEMFAPSTCVQDAWKVVMHLRATRFFAINLTAHTKITGSWMAGCDDLGDAREDDFEMMNVCAIADTAPLAICRVALMAIDDAAR